VNQSSDFTIGSCATSFPSTDRHCCRHRELRELPATKLTTVARHTESRSSIECDRESSSTANFDHFYLSADQHSLAAQSDRPSTQPFSLSEPLVSQIVSIPQHTAVLIVKTAWIFPVPEFTGARSDGDEASVQ
jgi:hypothetical protein